MKASEWRRVSSRWYRHRPEPLLHERLWGCALVGGDEEAALDEHGRAFALRERGGRLIEVAAIEGSAVVVRRARGVVVRTEFDAAGRAVRTTYPQDGGQVETYHYDAAGRLVAIDEPARLWATVTGSERWETGGRLTVTHDEHGPLLITGPAGTVWDRAEPPLAALLDQRVPGLAAACAKAVLAGASAARVRLGTPLWRVTLTPRGRGSLWPDVDVRIGGDPDYFEVTVPRDADLDTPLLRAACMWQTGDPYAAVLEPVAALLRTATWAPTLTPAPSLEVVVAETLD